MDWTNNTPRPAQPAPAPTAGTGGANAPKKKSKGKLSGGMKIVSIALLFSATALVVVVAYFLAVGKGNSQAQFVDDTKMQAVFLNGGQVYFGKIEDLNSQYLRMSNIYYLRVNQTVQPNQEGNNQAAADDISLVKLGCELHGPEDEMLINGDQIVFWENLKSDGQVAKAVDEYVKANPNGQKCETNQSQNTNTQTTPTTENQTNQ